MKFASSQILPVVPARVDPVAYSHDCALIASLYFYNFIILSENSYLIYTAVEKSSQKSSEKPAHCNPFKNKMKRSPYHIIKMHMQTSAHI